MEYGFCVVLGFLLGVFFGKIPKCKTHVTEISDEEKRRAQKALREYQNFMNYDGFTSQEE